MARLLALVAFLAVAWVGIVLLTIEAMRVP
jgi:hypothetical protein